MRSLCGLIRIRTQVSVSPNPHLGPGHELPPEPGPVARLAQPRAAPLHPLSPPGSAGRTCRGESREAAAHRHRKTVSSFARWGGAGPGRDHRARGGARPGHPEPERIPRPAPRRAPPRPAPPTRRRRHGRLPGRLLAAQLRESHPSARRAPPAHSCPVSSLRTVSSCAFLQTCLSGSAPRLRAPGPRSLGFPPPDSRPSPGPGRPRLLQPGPRVTAGEGWGAPGGGGSALRRPLPGAGETEARAGVGVGVAAPPRPAGRRPPGARFVVCLPDAPTLCVACPAAGPLCPGSSVPLPSLQQSVRPRPSASVCSLVFISCLSRSVRLSDCLCPSVASPSVIVYRSGSVRLSARPMSPCLRTFSLAQANSWHFSKEPHSRPSGPPGRVGSGQEAPVCLSETLGEVCAVASPGPALG